MHSTSQTVKSCQFLLNLFKSALTCCPTCTCSEEHVLGSYNITVFAGLLRSPQITEARQGDTPCTPRRANWLLTSFYLNKSGELCLKILLTNDVGNFNNTIDDPIIDRIFFVDTATVPVAYMIHGRIEHGMGSTERDRDSIYQPAPHQISKPHTYRCF